MKFRDILLGGAIGAGIMYLLDPSEGRRRRAFAREKGVHYAKKTQRTAQRTSQDVANRTKGVIAEALSSFRSRSGRPTELTADRVRSAIGRVVSNAGAIGVEAYGNRVILRGPILRAELPDLLRTVSSIHGVQEVDNELSVYDSAEGVPSLQGSALPLKFEGEIM